MPDVDVRTNEGVFIDVNLINGDITFDCWVLVSEINTTILYY